MGSHGFVSGLIWTVVLLLVELILTMLVVFYSGPLSKAANYTSSVLKKKG